MKPLSAKEMQKLDQWAIEELGIPQIALMENAGRAVAEAIAKTNRKARVLIVAYKGNNGGDGFVAARHLRNLGFEVSVFLLCAPKQISGSAKINLDILSKINIPIYQDKLSVLKKLLAETDVVIDAIFGIGLKGEIRGLAAQVIDLINQLKEDKKYAVVAVDVPSGINATTGQVDKHSIVADQTITFAAPKIGLFKYPAVKQIGKLVVADIGIPKKDQKAKLKDQKLEYFLPQRKVWTHKGSYGRVLIVAGSRNMSGAAYLAARSALRSGAGLVYLAVPNSVKKYVVIKSREVIVIGLPETKAASVSEEAFKHLTKIKADVLAVGPGLTTNPGTKKLIKRLVQEFKVKKMVIDADALNCLADQPLLLKKSKAEIIITPHPGEMSRLTKKKIDFIQKNRLEVAQQFAQKWQVEVVLKGAYTIVANQAGVSINSSGNPGMAKAGSGDVLCGMIAGLVAQGMLVKEAVYLHGLAGDLAAKTKGEYGLIASDIVEKIPHVLR